MRNINMESLCVGSFCLPSKSLSLQPFKCFWVLGKIGSLTIMMYSNYEVFDYDAISWQWNHATRQVVFRKYKNCSMLNLLVIMMMRRLKWFLASTVCNICVTNTLLTACPPPPTSKSNLSKTKMWKIANISNFSSAAYPWISQIQMFLRVVFFCCKCPVNVKSQISLRVLLRMYCEKTTFW